MKCGLKVQFVPISVMHIYLVHFFLGPIVHSEFALGYYSLGENIQEKLHYELYMDNIILLENVHFS